MDGRTPTFRNFRSSLLITQVKWHVLSQLMSNDRRGPFPLINRQNAQYRYITASAAGKIEKARTLMQREVNPSALREERAKKIPTRFA